MFGQGGNLTQILILYAVLGVAFYFFIFRPNSKRKKQQKEMRENLKKGSKIVTIGGFIGVIEHVGEESLTIKCADSILKIKKNAVHSVEEN